MSRLRDPWLIAGVIAWAAAIALWVQRFASLDLPHRGWLVDWHVYAAGARALVEGNLYVAPLRSEFHMPVTSFNMPPGSAFVALPFIALPDAIGGYLWVVLNVAATGVAALLTAWIVRARPMLLWSGLAFFLYSFALGRQLVLLGNNTPLLLMIVAGFVAAQQARLSTTAGVLLGIAIATKLWPVAFLAVVARERSWGTAAWAIGVSGAVFAGTLLWVGGADAIRPMISSLSYDVEIKKQILLGITWLRHHLDWWPAWGGYAIALILLLIPARGLIGYGLGTLAGLALIPNLWIHYLATVIFGAVLLVKGLVDWRREPDHAPQPLASPADRPTAPDAGTG
ncbi:MAG TPA: glycosyltransferase family 87 protein [Candidatus Limnocylindria bacterium]